MNKKKVFILALAVCLIAILSMSTLAWFNANDSVKNDFMFDDTNNDGTPDFMVNIFETGEDANIGGKEYLHVAPGAVLDKDPTVKNEGDYAMYTRVIVTLDNASTWIAISDKYSLVENDNLILEEMVDINANWTRFELPVYNTTADTLTYVYYYNDSVDADDTTASLFTKVTIPTAPQQDDMIFDDDMFSITVKADAIQSDNIITATTTLVNNSEAYTAFSIANWDAGSEYPQPATEPATETTEATEA